MTLTHTFFVSCPKGIEDLLLDEIKALGILNINNSFSGVSFEGELKDAYKVCLWSRLASRVLLQIKEFDAADDEQLYKQIQTINWPEYLDVEGTLAVSCHLINSSITNSQYAALKVKDAIVDQYMDKYDERPSVDREMPDLRINLFINKDQAILSLDMAGDALHKRGYRKSNVPAPMKENLAAAVLKRSGWPNENLTLVDLMCGSGTLLIEAAMMALDIAPGLRRKYYGFTNWPNYDVGSWSELKKEAQQKRDLNLNSKEVYIRGYDESLEAVRAANMNIEAAGLKNQILIDQREIEYCKKPDTDKTGLVVVNAPYGERLGEVEALRYLYAELGDCWKRYFGDWNTALFTGNIELAKNIGLRSHRDNAFYNGPIKCKLYHYTIRALKGDFDPEKQREKDNEARAMFKNRLKKNVKHVSRWAKRNNIECYRVYDVDLPEYAAAIDVYGEWVYVQEYQAPASIDIRKARQRIKQIIDVVPEVLTVDASKLVIKTRQQQKGINQYEKQSNDKQELTIHENGLQFIVNLHDYLDTGIFLDHRDTRVMIRDWAKDKDFLNLFAYTGAVSVYAAAGGARSVTTIDMSNTYLYWAERNFKMNGLFEDKHKFIKADCVNWLKHYQGSNSKYDLIFLDPPTFSNSKSMDSVFDLQKDHVELINHSMSLLNEDGMLIFSNNFRKFKLYENNLSEYQIEEITRKTIPEDFKRNQKIHRCWIIKNK
jgi:23S rRNA (guanine2445-N2)-methyltransferase / 23S rRNA (guanine2069-N7)-methyltransferase